MQIEEYFDFLASDGICIKETRVGIESVLYEYIYRNRSAKQIADSFSSINIEQVYATILYYLNNQETVEKYLLDWIIVG